jgi:hypothetical protein
MLNEAIKCVRDTVGRILDRRLPVQMTQITRGDNGEVNLNGKDRVVAYGLALMGRKHCPPRPNANKKKKSRVTGTGKEIHGSWVGENKKKTGDIFG